MKADVGKLARRALEEHIAAFLAVRPDQKLAHRKLAVRYDNLAAAVGERESGLGLGAIANERFNVDDFLPRGGRNEAIIIVMLCVQVGVLAATAFAVALRKPTTAKPGPI